MRRILTISGMLVMCAVSASAADLDLTPLHKNLQFNFGNPGARALGMGGAFLGRADDASAAEANPAGLTVISKHELTVEFRSNTGSTRFPFNATVATSSLPSTLLFSDVDTNKNSGVTFASFAMPVGPIALAAYYHVAMDLGGEGKIDPALVFGVPGTGGSVGQVLFFPGNFSTRYRSRVVGIAGAWRLGHFSFGASGKHQTLETKTSNKSFSNPLDSTTLRDSVIQDSSKSQNSYNLGLLWTSSTESLTFGAVYKKGSTFDIETSRSVCEPVLLPQIGKPNTDLAAKFSCPAQPNATTLSPFQVPDRYGVGMSVRFRGGLTFNEDIVRIKYSQLLTGFRSTIYCDAFSAAGYKDASGGPNAFCTAKSPTGSALGYSIPDATEVHLGAEYQLPRSPFAVRFGGWSTPPHEVNVTNVQNFASSAAFPAMTCKFKNGATELCQSRSQVYADASSQAALFYTGDTGGRQTHLTAGVGYAARSFEINAGYDRSKNTKTASIQLLTRF